MHTLRRPFIAGAALLVLHAVSAGAQMPGMGSGEQRTVIRGFTDVNFLTGGHNTGHKSGFALGQFDLYITSQLADRLSFLSETVFEFDEASSEFVVDVERVQVQYQLTDFLRLSAGKVHTPLGYWNNAYHHGTVMQPTISRPQLVEFEDDGGLLPVHSVGVQLSGRDISQAHLGFDVLLSNGLGNRPVASDESDAQAVTVAVHSQLTPALRIGLSAYRDRAGAGTATLNSGALAAPMTQTIGGGFLAYLDERAEVIVEGHHVSNESAGRSTSSPGWFAYAGIRADERVVPYAMHEDIHTADGDPFFVSERLRRETVGIRYEQAATVVYKLEFRSLDQRGAKRASELALQLALAF